MNFFAKKKLEELMTCDDDNARRSEDMLNNTREDSHLPSSEELVIWFPLFRMRGH
jgi:hypothetical protein